MIAILKPGTTEKQRDSLCDWFRSMGLEVHVSQGQFHCIIGLIGDTTKVDITLLESLSIIESVKRISEPFKNANRKFHTEDSVIDVGGGLKIGGGHFEVIGGPCSVESDEQMVNVGRRIKAAGGNLLRGGAFNYFPWGLRASNRVHHPGSWRMIMAGFRCAMDWPPVR